MNVDSKDLNPAEAGGPSMWLVVAVVFGLMIAAWVTMFTIAMRNPVATVPLEHHVPKPANAR